MQLAEGKEHLEEKATQFEKARTWVGDGEVAWEEGLEEGDEPFSSR